MRDPTRWLFAAMLVAACSRTVPGVTCPPGGSCPGGSLCVEGICVVCRPLELNCADGVDEDCDGLVDCADPDCLGVGCGPSGACGANRCDEAGACAQQLKPVATECRARRGPCDVPEICDGVSLDCPPDAVAVASAPCAAGGACENGTCDGTTVECHPAGGVARRGVVCRTGAGPCELDATCDGFSPQCPSSAFVPAGTVCRPPVGACDVAEKCLGTSADCPPDGLSTQGKVCRSPAGPCDLAEACTGLVPSCPTDRFVAAGDVCRPALSECDLPESCDGGHAACPSDRVAGQGTSCEGVFACTGLARYCPSAIPAGADWYWDAPRPQGNDLNGVWVDPGTGEILAVGAVGTILRFDGSRWRAEESGTEKALRGVWGSGLADVWAVGDLATILHRDDTGWSPVLAPAAVTADLNAVHGTGANNVWAAGPNGVVLKLSTSGIESRLLQADTALLEGVWVAESGDVWVVGSRPGGMGNPVPVVASLPFGATPWSYQGVGSSNLGGLHAVFGLSVDDLWGAGQTSDVGSSSGLLVGLGSGATGGSIDTLAGIPRALWGTATTDLFAVGDDGLIEHRASGIWSTEGDVDASLADVWGTDAQLVAVGALGTVVTSDGNGDWAPTMPPMVPPGVASGLPAGVVALGGSTPDGLWAIVSTTFGDSVVLRRSGGAWAHVRTVGPSESTLTALWVSAGGEAWVVGNGGFVLRFGTGGTLDDSSVDGSPSLRGIWAHSSTNAWAVGSGFSGGIFRWDGADWTKAETGSATDFVSVWGSGASDVYALEGSNGDSVLWRWQGGTSVWHEVQTFAGVELTQVTGSGPSDVWLGGREGTSFHLVGDNLAQISLASPLTEPMAIWSAGSGDAWAAAGPRLFRWLGQEWTPQLLRTPDFTSLSVVWGFDASDVWVGGLAVGNILTPVVLHYVPSGP